ncbi:GbsR/MarR family transcriptional regulator [Nocardia stercoris]|uniref:MarR family transcriptional regulator n=1 Tax=Nocardia stercoris TaxID=2483361 RepID=A0A3M2LCK3_9NOCA|nr:helix-turn-helix domain-containing protein [Nocardia stercoris]RMI35241.1 MarR family transcriptional regulator [Nocardia stercoris]
MPGGRLTAEDRRQIAGGLAAGLGYAEIGRRLNRPASTIMREVTRNGGLGNYAPDRAEAATHDRARRTKSAPTAEPHLPDSRHDPTAVREIVESFTDLLVRQGLPKMEARVLACLQVTDSGALTAGELVQRLGVSPASISTAVGYLENLGLLRRERLPGERREHYVVDEEIWLRNVLTTLRLNNALMASARRAAGTLGRTTPAGARFESSAELLALVGEAIGRAVEQWKQQMSADDAEPEAQ